MGISAQISVKPTQLGLDLGSELCLANLRQLVQRADATGNFVWIDMESSHYVDRTLAIFRRIREESASIGVCVQAYLYRTADLAGLLPFAPAVRLVKGAYNEVRSLAFTRKPDVDENFVRLALEFFDPRGNWPGQLRRCRDTGRDGDSTCEARGVTAIRAAQRVRDPDVVRHSTGPAAAGERLRVLISYEEYWFPWYMRRLAERPANVVRGEPGGELTELPSDDVVGFVHRESVQVGESPGRPAVSLGKGGKRCDAPAA